MELWFGPFCALMGSVTWAIGGTTFAKMSQRTSGPTVNFSRALFAWPLFVLTAILVSGGVGSFSSELGSVSSTTLGWLGLSMFVSYGLGDYFFFSAARFLGVPGSLAIASIYPVWTVTLGVLIQGNQIAPIQVAGLLAVVAGIVGVILGDPAAQKSLKTEHPKPPRHAWIGFTLAIGASVCWATNSFAVSRAGAEVSPLIGNSIRMFFALGITTVMRFLMAPQAPVWVGWKEFKSKSWVFFLEAFGGSLFFLYGLAHSSLLVGTTLSSLSPVIALPIAVLLKIEKLTWIRSLGVVFTVIGVTLILIR